MIHALHQGASAQEGTHLPLDKSLLERGPDRSVQHSQVLSVLCGLSIIE